MPGYALPNHQLFQRSTDARRDRHRLLHPALDEDMDEMPGSSRMGLAVAKQADLVTDGAVAKLRRAQAGLDGFRKTDRLVEAAGGLDHQADARIVHHVEATEPDHVKIGQAPGRE